MQNYWKERDEWRTLDGLDPKWEGTNISMAFSLLKRNGSLEDHATMQRLAAGKRWEHARHNHILCKACLGDFRGQRHPLLLCYNLTMIKARKTWLDNCRSFISIVKPEKLRPKMLEILHHATKTEGGEYACLGTFIPSWVSHLEDGQILTQFDLRAIKKFLRVLASGARLVMREFARVKEVSEGNARELRQLSIVQFTEAEPTTAKSPKVQAGKPARNNAPPDNSWGPSERVHGIKLKWLLRIQPALIADNLVGSTNQGRSLQSSLLDKSRNLSITQGSSLPPMGFDPDKTIAKGRRVGGRAATFIFWAGLN